MAEAPTKLPVKNKEKPVTPAGNFRSPLETLRAEVDRLFDDFMPTSWHAPDLFSSGHLLNGWNTAPAVDLVEKDDVYEVTAECPGLDAKNIEVKFSNGLLTIRGENVKKRKTSKKNITFRNGDMARSSAVSPCRITSTLTK